MSKYFLSLILFLAAMPLWSSEMKRIKIIVKDKAAVATLYDTPAAEDLLNQLPLDVIMKDFASKEKIYVLPKKLRTSNPSSQSGDLAFYIPWGNVALFYNQTMVSDEDLLILGKFESGREILNVPGNIKVRIEILEK
jgi:hypothetical protein